MSEKIKQIVVMIATSGVVFVNYLAADGIINNKTTGELAEKYATDITPAGYAFSIWGLIYLGLIAFSIYQALPTQTDNYLFKKIRSVYVVNCIANCAWIYAWHYESISLSGLIMLILLGTLVYINIVLVKAESAAEIITTKVPFNIYFGWITVATILNVTIMLVYLGIQFPDHITSIVGAILIFIVTGLGIILRFKISSAFYPATLAWGLTAIAVEQSQNTIILIATAIGVIVLLIAALAEFARDE